MRQTGKTLRTTISVPVLSETFTRTSIQVLIRVPSTTMPVKLFAFVAMTSDGLPNLTNQKSSGRRGPQVAGMFPNRL
jgi:hypothetical protein